MKLNFFTKSTSSIVHALLVLFLLLAISCSTDELIFDEEADMISEIDEEEVAEEDTTEDNDTQDGDMEDEDSQSSNNSCTDSENFVFNEENGLVFIEFENGDFPENWTLKAEGDNFTGDGYMVWEGAQSLSNPGSGTTIFKIKIETAGTYQFIWRSAVQTGNSGSDHNDTWLRFNDAADFYAEKSDSIVYPAGTGKTPNPAGATKEGWFKIYRSGNDLDFKWQAKTYDNNAHDIFVAFDTAGTYTMEISARSSGHAIDKFALFNENHTVAEATSDDVIASEISCGN